MDYVIDRSQQPPMCLPRHVYETKDLLDITQVQDTFRRYIEKDTGKEHDGAVYAQQMQREARHGL